jgi:UDP-GlcNAc:undecaprenyl-phosphate/decaprenyl-phosphate GlcNAc-1-phosphate transferase
MINFFVLSFFGTVAAIPALQWVARRYRLYDFAEEDELKIHKKPTSYLGGAAILVGVGVGFFAIGFPVGIAAGALLLFGLGLWDDMRWKHISQRKPYIKFVGLLLLPACAAAALVYTGFGLHFFEITFVAAIATFSYIFLVINALNYQDGMDGLAGGLVAMSAVGFLFLASLTGNFFAGALASVLLGVSLAFLGFNFPPAKIFMGDSGAYLLGFLLVVVASLFAKPFHVPLLIGPALIIGLPIADGVFTNARRLVSGKSIFFGDRAHFYDRLLQRGFSQRKTLVVAYLLQGVFVVLGVIISIQEIS